MGLFDRFLKPKVSIKDDFDGWAYMSYDELMSKLAGLNFQWRVEFEQSHQEIINEVRNIEQQLASMRHIGNEFFEDAPLTGTEEEIQEKWSLEKKILGIKHDIVKHFKANTDMNRIPLEQKRFLYRSEKDYIIENNISTEFDADLPLYTPNNGGAKKR